jgi:hypothetical protein
MTKPNTSKPPAEHPLVGRGLHYSDKHGVILNTATVLTVVPSNSSVGDLALIQYWVDGEPAPLQRLIPLSELVSKRWVFFTRPDEEDEKMSVHVSRSAHTPPSSSRQEGMR